MGGMNKAAQSLSSHVKKLQALLVEKDSEIKSLQEKNQYLLEQFRLAQQRQFGKSSESHPGQGELFNEAEQITDEILAEEKAPTQKKRKQPKRQALPKGLARKTIVIDLTDEEKTCDCCGNDLHQMGEKKSEQLEFIPAQVKVIETVPYPRRPLFIRLLAGCLLPAHCISASCLSMQRPTDARRRPLVVLSQRYTCRRISECGNDVRFPKADMYSCSQTAWRILGCNCLSCRCGDHSR